MKPGSRLQAAFARAGLTAETVTGRRVLLLLTVGALLVLALAACERFIHARGAPTVLDLELSFSAARFHHILGRWGSRGVGLFRARTLLDSFFAVAYGAFLRALYLWVTARLAVPARAFFALAPVAAALLDWIENALLLALARPGLEPTPGSETLVWYVGIAAALKLTLILLALAGTAVALLRSSKGHVLVTCRFSVLSLLLGSLPLLLVPQGQDVVRSLVDAATPAGIRVVSIAALVLWSASVWYWARVLLTIRFPGAPPPAAPDLFRVWAPRVLGALTLALGGLAFFLAAADSGDRGWMLVLFGLVCLLLAAAFLAFVTRRRRWLRRWVAYVPGAADQFAWRGLPQGTKAATGLSMGASLAFLLLFTFWPVWTTRWLGTAAVLLMAAANAVFFGSATVLFGRLLQVPIATLALLAAAVFSSWNDNHFVRLAEEDGRPVGVKERPSLRPAFERWLREREGGAGNPVPVILVAAEGGGIRAAYWTASVLGRLQDANPAFARHVFAISSVSGGSLGAATFLSLLADEGGHPCSRDAAEGGRFQRCAEEVLGNNFLAPALAKMVAPDFLQWFVPFPVPWFDRARALEDAWADAYGRATDRDSFSRPFLDLWAAGETALPALFLNGTHVQTGRRLVASSLRWRPEDLPDAWDLHDLLGADLPLKTAVHNSARFAYVSPAGRLASRKGEFGHVVDGGYFENSGAATLHDLFHALRERPEAPPRARFVALYLCNRPGRCWQGGEPGEAGALPRPQNLAEWFSPVRALLGAREARAGQALAELRREKPREHHGDHEIELVEFGVCPDFAQAEKRAPLPLGWQLSERVRKEMTEQLGEECPGNRESLDRVESLLAASREDGPP